MTPAELDSVLGAVVESTRRRTVTAHHVVRQTEPEELPGTLAWAAFRRDSVDPGRPFASRIGAELYALTGGVP